MTSDHPILSEQGDGETPQGLVLGAIPGASPDKWVTRWRQRYPEIPLTVRYDEDAGVLERVRIGEADIAYLRHRAQDQTSPEGSFEANSEDSSGGSPEQSESELFHRVQIYTEQAVVCAAADHWVAAAEESVDWADIAEEPFIDPVEMGVSGPGAELAADERMAMEVVASGAGLLMLPNSVARALSRKDVVIRTLTDHPGFTVSLVWLREKDSPEIQEFIGIARGRKQSSGRSQLEPAGPKKGKKAKQAAARAEPSQRKSRQQPRSPRGRPPRGRRRPR